MTLRVDIRGDIFTVKTARGGLYTAYLGPRARAR